MNYENRNKKGGNKNHTFCHQRCLTQQPTHVALASVLMLDKKKIKKYMVFHVKCGIALQQKMNPQ